MFKQTQRRSDEAQLWRVVAAFMPVLIPISLFSNTFTLYSVAPIAGWFNTNQVNASEQFVGCTREDALSIGLSHD